MNDQQIVDYWYKHLYKLYPFIHWKVEVEVDGFLKITGMNLVCMIEDETIATHFFKICNKGDRNFVRQNKIIAHDIKRLVGSLKTRSSRQMRKLGWPHEQHMSSEYILAYFSKIWKICKSSETT